MDFFLVRHGEAKPEYEDPRRPLTGRGRREVEKVARALRKKNVAVAEVLHSGKLRAKQTAEIMARFLSPARGARETTGLAPEDDPALAKAELKAAGASVMLVGHLPHLGRLAALLVTGDSERSVVEFPPASVACLSGAEDGWKLAWSLSPDML
ncbi:MAG: phosphohistidine phosphatase SixA [Deltaproteobacteria bacterium RIFCSPLOWO2_12_FULL_60_19]|nr:MAG: phosphohistidine phosphatase SixA [Deltaproteobacteria bacterium RIFCSPLOWO2_12_FULL_60_19]